MGDDTLEVLITILEVSVRRNGERPLTNLWLLNLLRMVQRHREDCEDHPGVSGEEFWKD